MMKLTDDQKNRLRLINRSLKGGEWARCTPHTFPLVKDLPSELVELDEPNLRVRLTEVGKNVVEWM